MNIFEQWIEETLLMEQYVWILINHIENSIAIHICFADGQLCIRKKSHATQKTHKNRTEKGGFSRLKEEKRKNVTGRHLVEVLDRLI